MFKKCLVLAVLFVAGPVVASAANDDGTGSTPAFVNAFSGQWTSFDPAVGKGGHCELDLKKTPTGSNYVVGRTNCGGALADVTSWGIVDQQLALLEPGGKVAARLGGNQNRISGTLDSGSEIILERTKAARRIHAQWSSLKCVYLGYGSKCASPAQLEAPANVTATSPEKVSVLVKLNARSEPRPDAKVVSVLAPKSCVAVAGCTQAASGAWCKVSSEGKTAWISQKAVRLGEYPIITFVSGCK